MRFLDRIRKSVHEVKKQPNIRPKSHITCLNLTHLISNLNPISHLSLHSTPPRLPPPFSLPSPLLSSLKPRHSLLSLKPQRPPLSLFSLKHSTLIVNPKQQRTPPLPSHRIQTIVQQRTPQQRAPPLVVIIVEFIAVLVVLIEFIILVVRRHYLHQTSSIVL